MSPRRLHVQVSDDAAERIARDLSLQSCYPESVCIQILNRDRRVLIEALARALFVDSPDRLLLSPTAAKAAWDDGSLDASVYSDFIEQARATLQDTAMIEAAEARFAVA